MRTTLLRLADRHRDVAERRWIVPGEVHAIRHRPAHETPRGWGAEITFPHLDHRGEIVRLGLDLGRHRAMARREIETVLARAAEREPLACETLVLMAKAQARAVRIRHARQKARAKAKASKREIDRAGLEDVLPDAIEETRRAIAATRRALSR